MKRIKKTLAAVMILTMMFTVGCAPENNDADVRVTTYTPQDITATTAVCGGDVIVTQGLSVNKLGVCWGKELNPTIEDDTVSTTNWREPFVYTISNLEANVEYHTRAYAIRGLVCYYGEDKSFTTEDATLPTVTTAEPTDITQTTVNCGGEVTSDGGDEVTERGVCWSTSQNPTIRDSHTTDSTGTGQFTSSLTGLTANTTYYVRAYATNSKGTAYGTQRSFTTEQLPTYTIGVSTNPPNGGMVNGGGTYLQGQSCTVTALANTGYTFVSWTENDSLVSTNPSYTFTVAASRILVAHFQQQSFAISVSANPSSDGSVSGGGTYYYGWPCTVQATAASGYVFMNWTENGTQVSANASYTFTVINDRALEANFVVRPPAPTGAIDGLFSVSATEQVYFSQGNLQYQASTDTWRFATNQYDYIGDANNNISQYCSGWIDLFGWGTSGYNHGAVCYQPWSTSTTNSSYCAYGSYDYNLYDQTGQADWGYNPISNGGNQENQWRTLTKAEWVYVFDTRSTASGIRYAKAEVNDVNGVILLPDDWSSSTYSLNSTNTSDASFSSNTITSAQWATLEQVGAVFLPAAGGRVETLVGGAGSRGGYWSASYYTNNKAYRVYISDSYLDPQYFNSRNDGFSVRLARVAE